MATRFSTLMTMRATIKRSGGAKDGYGGQAVPESWQIMSPSEPCRIYIKRGYQTQDGGKVVAIEDMKMIVKPTADILAGDRIDAVQDRRGQSLFDGILYVNMISPKMSGAVITHQEVVLKRTR